MTIISKITRNMITIANVMLLPLELFLEVGPVFGLEEGGFSVGTFEESLKIKRKSSQVIHKSESYNLDFTQRVKTVTLSMIKQYQSVSIPIFHS